MSNIFIGSKKTCLGVLNRGERENDNEIGLKEGGGIEMSTTVLPLRDARSLRLNTHLSSFVKNVSIMVPKAKLYLDKTDKPLTEVHVIHFQMTSTGRIKVGYEESHVFTSVIRYFG